MAEQYDNGAFNKARVMNAAFSELMKSFPNKFDCVIFHDVDMILENDKNLHTCSKMPRHLSPGKCSRKKGNFLLRVAKN